MTTAIDVLQRSAIEYPDSDGLPMADNTLQGRCMITIYGGIEAIYLDDPSVFVTFNLLWYPVEGEPTIRIAPDVLVAFGRPKVDRGSYMHWKEGDVPPHVVFDVLAPGNQPGEMRRKFLFYQQYGVEEYYIYDPDDGSLEGWRRAGHRLRTIRKMAGFVSPRLKIRFQPEKGPDSLIILGPDGRKFLTYAELVQQSQTMERIARVERQHADEQARLALAERQHADEQARLADNLRIRNERLAARLRELGIEPD
jgi:Uma2 family endonuclease